MFYTRSEIVLNMKLFSIVVVALVLLAQLVNSQNLTVPGAAKHFYWKQYYDVIPKDAIPGGKTKDGDVIYIGCAVANLYGESYGVYPGSIVTGAAKIDITVGGQVQKTDLSRMILCSKTAKKFHWTKQSSWTFSTTCITRNPVPGGLQFDGIVSKYIYIGRVQHDYGDVIGKIPYLTGDTENPLYYASANDEQVQTDHYEVLVLEL